MNPEAETSPVVLKLAPGTAPPALKPPAGADAVAHRQLLEGPFWQRVPAYAAVSPAEFLDHTWQAKHSITNIPKLLTALKGLVSDEFIADAEAGFKQAPMSVRVSPYLLSLIDWSDPYNDPLRLQFIPIASRLYPDHPFLDLDSLHERKDMPVPGLTHRYPDKALFLALDICPVYCRFCTRSYAVGIDTEEVAKFHLRVNADRWAATFAYIASRPELEDIVISGGDAYQLRAEQITHIGEALLAIPHVRRFRYATKGPAVMPQKILTDTEWTDALCRIVEKGRKLAKEVVLHTHFNHPREITAMTKDALDLLHARGVTVRNQTVLQRGVNDDAALQVLLAKRLSYVNVHPYYIYMHDLVKGVEDLRTTLDSGLAIEKELRGATSGFNTPLVVVDAPGGGGKRDAHSFEHYDRVTGISVYTSPAVSRGQLYFYFDPIDLLPPEGQRRWADPAQHAVMMAEARAAAERGDKGSAPALVGTLP
jgi:lysine 2,3-aminomutase